MLEAKGSVPALQNPAGVLLLNTTHEIKNTVHTSPSPSATPIPTPICAQDHIWSQALIAVLIFIKVFILEISSN